MSSTDLAGIVGRNIRAARDAAGLTQTQLALKIGSTRSMAVSEWERGVHKPSDGALIRLSQVLEQDIAWFYTSHGREKKNGAAA